MPAIGRPCLAVHVLAALPGNMPELVIRSGVSKSAVFRAIQAAHEAGTVHISRWDYPVHGGRPTPYYVAGPGKDAVCRLKPQTAAVAAAKHRKRAKADGRWEHRNAAVRARYWANRAREKADPMVSALFGKAA